MKSGEGRRETEEVLFVKDSEYMINGECNSRSDFLTRALMGTAGTQWKMPETNGCRRTGHGVPRIHRAGKVRERIQHVS